MADTTQDHLAGADAKAGAFTPPTDGVRATAPTYEELAAVIRAAAAAAFPRVDIAAMAERLAAGAKGGLKPPEFQKVTWGIDSVMRPCTGMAISEYAFRVWCLLNGIQLADGAEEQS